MKIVAARLGAALTMLGAAFGTGYLCASGAGVAQAAAPPDPSAVERNAGDALAAWIEAAAPGPAHERMNVLAGDWDTVGRVWITPDEPPVESPASVHREWVLGGRYLREEVESRTPFGPFHGLGYLGYNNTDGLYEFVWMEDHSTAIMLEKGTWDPDARVLRTHGTHRDPASGRLVSTRTELAVERADRHVITMWATDEDGREYRAFEAVFERR